jgi:putative ABC transport system permease protein
MALGARRGDMLRMVLGESMLLVLFGIAIGVPAALLSSRVIASLLFGVGATDPLTMVGAALVMIAVAALAAGLPARRASRVDPMAALRYE